LQLQKSYKKKKKKKNKIKIMTCDHRQKKLPEGFHVRLLADLLSQAYQIMEMSISKQQLQMRLKLEYKIKGSTEDAWAS
jgi:hypothetical protein